MFSHKIRGKKKAHVSVDNPAPLIDQKNGKFNKIPTNR